MKNIGIFIEDLAKFNSSTMIANLPQIMKQLDSDAHQVRSSYWLLANIVILLDKSLKGDTGASEAVARLRLRRTKRATPRRRKERRRVTPNGCPCRSWAAR